MAQVLLAPGLPGVRQDARLPVAVGLEDLVELLRGSLQQLVPRGVPGIEVGLGDIVLQHRQLVAGLDQVGLHLGRRVLGRLVMPQYGLVAFAWTGGLLGHLVEQVPVADLETIEAFEEDRLRLGGEHRADLREALGLLRLVLGELGQHQLLLCPLDGHVARGKQRPAHRRVLGVRLEEFLQVDLRLVHLLLGLLGAVGLLGGRHPQTVAPLQVQ